MVLRFPAVTIKGYKTKEWNRLTGADSFLGAAELIRKFPAFYVIGKFGSTFKIPPHAQ
jgi:hypothetical protein